MEAKLDWRSCAQSWISNADAIEATDRSARLLSPWSVTLLLLIELQLSRGRGEGEVH